MSRFRSRLLLLAFLLLIAGGVALRVFGPSKFHDVSGKIEFALVAESGPPALVLRDAHIGSEPRELGVETPRAFEMKSAYTVKDHDTGETMLGFEMTEADSNRFHDWTGANVGRKMALLYDRRVCSVATVAGALTGKSLLPFRLSDGRDDGGGDPALHGLKSQSHH